MARHVWQRRADVVARVVAVLVGAMLLAGCGSPQRESHSRWQASSAWRSVETDFYFHSNLTGAFVSLRDHPFLADATDSLREDAGKKLSQEAAMDFAEKILDRCESQALSNVQGGQKALVVGRFAGKRNEQRLDMDLVNREFRHQLSNHPTLKERFVLVTVDAEDREALIRKINGRGDPNSGIDSSLATVDPADTYVLTGEWYSEEAFPKGSWANQPPTFKVTAYLTLRSLTQPSGEGDVRETQTWVYHPTLGWITYERNASLASADPSDGIGTGPPVYPTHPLERPANVRVQLTQPLRTICDDLRANDDASELSLCRRKLANHLDGWISAVERSVNGEHDATQEVDEGIRLLKNPIEGLLPDAKELSPEDLERLRGDAAKVLENLKAAREDLGN